MAIRHYGTVDPDKMRDIVEAAATVKAKHIEITRENTDSHPVIDQWGSRVPLYAVTVEFDEED